MGLVTMDGLGVRSSALQGRSRGRRLSLAVTPWRSKVGEAAALTFLRPKTGQGTTCAELAMADTTLDQSAEDDGAMALRSHTLLTLMRKGPPALPPHVLGPFISADPGVLPVTSTGSENITLDGDQSPKN